MIHIDFQAGSHGQYLAFVCNKFLAQIPCNDSPFNDLGSAHNKIHYAQVEFRAKHYFEGEIKQLFNKKIISIQITHDDLLPLSSISFLRAGDQNLDNDKLEIDTYNKLNNEANKWVLQNILTSFFKTQVQESYNAVKDDSWPSVSSLEDFYNLPDWIQKECLEQHNLQLLELNQQHPDCPRRVLREFFKIGFQFPAQAGFIVKQQDMIYDVSNDVLYFPYSCFYNTQEFVKQIKRVGQWSEHELADLEKLLDLHKEFLERQPYKNSKLICDQLIQRICDQEKFDLPKLDLFQESYMWAHLERRLGRELANNQDKWFTNSQQILESIVQ